MELTGLKIEYEPGNDEGTHAVIALKGFLDVKGKGRFAELRDKVEHFVSMVENFDEDCDCECPQKERSDV